MNKKEIIAYSAIFAFVSIVTMNFVFYSLSGHSFFQHLPKNGSSNDIIEVGHCSTKSKIQGLGQSVDPHLKQLDKYQDLCKSFAVDRMMIFTDMPKDEDEAKDKANKMADTLKEFAKYGIQPIVIIEPVNEWGLIDFGEFKTGFYNDWIDKYFEQLKESDVTDEMMGIWIPFPEANIPSWNHNNTSPEDFSVVVNVYLKILKKHFPDTKTSILLNSATYETDDFNWMNGQYISLRDYVMGIESGLIDSFGIQGFPWEAPADEDSGKMFDARVFLSSRLAMEAADILGVQEIWFNTGTFSEKYTSDEEKKIQASAKDREIILDGIYDEIQKVKSEDYNVWINLFAENKSQKEEATNWSYWQSDTVNIEHEAILVNFLSKLSDADIAVSLFDIEQ